MRFSFGIYTIKKKFVFHFHNKISPSLLLNVTDNRYKTRFKESIHNLSPTMQIQLLMIFLNYLFWFFVKGRFIFLSSYYTFLKKWIILFVTAILFGFKFQLGCLLTAWLLLIFLCCMNCLQLRFRICNIGIILTATCRCLCSPVDNRSKTQSKLFPVTIKTRMIMMMMMIWRVWHFSSQELL